MFQFRNSKTKRIIAGIIVAVLVVSMLLSVAIAAMF